MVNTVEFSVFLSNSKCKIYKIIQQGTGKLVINIFNFPMDIKDKDRKQWGDACPASTLAVIMREGNSVVGDACPASTLADITREGNSVEKTVLGETCN